MARNVTENVATRVKSTRERNEPPAGGGETWHPTGGSRRGGVTLSRLCSALGQTGDVGGVGRYVGRIRRLEALQGILSSGDVRGELILGELVKRGRALGVEQGGAQGLSVASHAKEILGNRSSHAGWIDVRVLIIRLCVTAPLSHNL